MNLSHDVVTDVSVIICTRDRADSLDRVLRSLEAMDVPDGLAWEVVVVDNGSTDPTPAVVESFRGDLPIRHVVEARAGLSNARNCGVAAARGRTIVWTDDDVEVHPGWLRAYAEAFERYPEHSLFGGCSVAVFEEAGPGWFRANTDALRDLLAIRDFGPEPVDISLATGNVPFGLNYAVRADVQRRFLYDPDLGVAPNRRISGEEVDFYERVLAAGYSGLCLPGPLVRHHIPRSRQTVDYVWSYYASAGETSAILRYRGRPPKPQDFRSLRLKFHVSRALYVASRVLPLSARVRTLARHAFHTGRMSRLKRASVRLGGSPPGAGARDKKSQSGAAGPEARRALQRTMIRPPELARPLQAET